jgi:two-component system, cell cycle response regulator DivK
MTTPARILLIEDNEDNRIIYRSMLEYSGYQVLEAVDGQQGMDEAYAQVPDLILMDISLPVVDGWDATRWLKAEPKTKHIPIIALTAHALASDQVKAFEVGCDAYLAKPVEPRTVLAEVERMLARASS